jgi:ankyrin repeat protein
VKCQMDHLCQLNNDRDRRNALDSLPPDLFSTYKRILDRVVASHKGNQILVQKVLRWIVCAKEPLNIRALAEAVSIQDGDEKVDFDAIPDEEDILMWCSSLVRKSTIKNIEVLELSHFSVKEFLSSIDIEKSNLVSFAIRTTESNIELGKVCLTYIGFKDFENGYCYDTLSYKDRESRYPFLKYATTNWYKHAADNIAHQDQFPLICQLFELPKTQQFLCWSQGLAVEERGGVARDSDLNMAIQILSDTTPLHLASALALHELVGWLIQNGAEVNKIGQYLGTPLCCAIGGIFCLSDYDDVWDAKTDPTWREEDRHKTVLTLLKSGADVDAARNPDFSPLSIALKIEDSVIVNSLVEKGATLTRDAFSQLLEWCKDLDENNLIGELFDKITTKNLREEDRSYVAGRLLELNEKRIACNALGEMTRTQNSTSDNGYSYALRKAAEYGQTDLVESILELNLDVDLTDIDSKTALHLSSQNGHLEIVKSLIGNGADITKTDKMGHTPLHYASMGTNSMVLQYLLDCYVAGKLDIAPKSSAGLTPFMLACKAGSLENVTIFSSINGAIDLATKSRDGCSCLHLASSSPNDRLVKLLLDKGFQIDEQAANGSTPLHDAIRAGRSVEVVKLLLTRGASPNTKMCSGRSPLHVAILATAPFDMIKTLCGNATVDFEATDDDGRTPLLATAYQMTKADYIGSYTKILQFLITSDCKTTVIDKTGKSALHYLCQIKKDNYGLDKHIHSFLQDGDVNTRDRAGESAFTYALRTGRRSLVELLIDKVSNEDLGALYGAGLQPLSIAISARNEQIVELLLNRFPNVEIKGSDISGRTPVHWTCTQNTSASLSKRMFSLCKDLSVLDGYGYSFLDLACDYGNSNMAEELIAGGTDINQSEPANEGRWKPLYLAARGGHRAIALLLLEKGADINAKIKGGWTALHGAAFRGHSEVVRLLLEKKVDIEAKNRSGRTALHEAVSYGRLTAVQLLLEMGADLAAKTEEGWTALHEAAFKGHNKIVELLVEEGADIKTKTHFGSTAMHLAAKEGHQEIVQLLVAEGVDVEAKEENGWTALHAAASKGHTNLARLLVEEKANIEAKDKDGWTPLHRAAFDGHKEVVHLLLEKKADIKAKNMFGWTALHEAALNGHEGIVRLLLVEGADIEAKNKDGLTALHMAARKGYETVVQLLMEEKANIEAKDKDGWTALHIAAFDGHQEVVHLLLEKKADIKVKNKVGGTALHGAAFSGHEGIVQLLLVEGADIEAKNKDGLTALHTAAQKGYETVVRLLMEEKANIDAKDKDGWTALYRAAFGGHQEVVHLLLEKKADIKVKNKVGGTALHAAAFSGHEEIVRLLLVEGADIEAKNKDGLTALHMAARKGHETVVQMLVEEKANIEAKDKDGWTALHIAAFDGHQEVVHLLLEKKADIKARTNLQKTVLHLAAHDGHKAVMQLLIQKGSNIEAKNRHDVTGEMTDLETKDEDGRTALHYAASNGHQEVVRLLVEKGAAIEAKDKDGKTALQLSSQNGHSEVTKLLLESGADIKAHNNDGWTAFHLASSNGQLDILRLLGENVEVDVKNRFGLTALHIASWNNHAEVVRLLIDKGGSPAAEDIRGYSPLHFAALGGASDCVDILLKYCDPQLVDRNGWTPALIAARCGHEEISKRLQHDKLDFPQILSHSPTAWSPDDKANPLRLTNENLIVEYPGKTSVGEIRGCINIMSR